MHISKDELLMKVRSSVIYEKKPIEVPIRYLNFTFGFTRKAGLEIAISQLMFPSKSEMDICMSMPREIIARIDDWCKETGFMGCYQPHTDSYLFYAIRHS